MSARPQPPPLSPADELLTAQEAAAVLGVGVKWVRRAGAHQLLPVVRIGANVRFRRGDLAAYIAAHTTPAAPPSGGNR